MAKSTGWTISIDAGGTFTDAVARSTDGGLEVAKVASTPDDPARGLTNAVAALAADGVNLADVQLVCHGTTVATNAMLTNSMGAVVLITTEGFRDVLAYRTGSRPQVYSLTPVPPTELVPRDRRLEVHERVAADGTVLTELTDDEIDRVVARVRELAPEAVAVSLLFSFVNPEHEQRLGDALRASLPEVPVSLSCDVVREFREYPRTATTALNAALRPVVTDYLGSATAGLAAAGVASPLQVMQSNGGCVPAPRANCCCSQRVAAPRGWNSPGQMMLSPRSGDRTAASDYVWKAKCGSIPKGRAAFFASGNQKLLQVLATLSTRSAYPAAPGVLYACVII